MHIFTHTLLLSLAPFIQAENSWKQTFDYVIVGAGPAGLVVANRLSEDPSITVAVVEAGADERNNPNVTRTDGFFLGLGTHIDWGYPSAPQKYASNRTLTFSAGKALGGTTTINGMTYLRAEKDQIDQWEGLGNEGWGWEQMLEYYRLQEHFQRPDMGTAENGATFEEQHHGFRGELGVGWNKAFMKQGIFRILKDTSVNMGLAWNFDANGGKLGGFSTWPLTLNSTTGTREDASTAYYHPVEKIRQNLKVFPKTTATKIVWSKKTRGSKAIAQGLEVIAPGNIIETLFAGEEVLLCAGSLRSPAILELSGIGNPAILNPLGITTVVTLPTVGANLQDQPNNQISFGSSTNWTGYPSFVTYLTASELFGSELSRIAEEIRANASDYARRIVADCLPNETTIEREEHLIQLQLNLAFNANSTVPMAELVWFPSGNSITVAFWALLPFSRGSVHITSALPTQMPRMDPNFFQQPIDILIQAAAAVKVREYFSTAPLSIHVTSELTPGVEAVPEGASWSDPAWKDWLATSFSSNSHPVSSAAMRSRKLGGVVDNEGKVYGVANVRVADASAFPTQISGHLSASVYAMAGRIAGKMRTARKAQKGRMGWMTHLNMFN